MKIKDLLLPLLFLILYFLRVEAFEKVVIWGHKLHSHTHSYIHKGFYDGFKHLGYTTYWLDNQDDVSNFNFSNTLFLTEGQVDQNIPLREDGIYLTHNCSSKKYQGLKQACFQVYTDDVLSRPNTIQADKFIYFSVINKTIYMPWATNLLPDQIEQIKKEVSLKKKKKEVYWIGTIGDGRFGNRTELDPFISACKENNISFTAPNPSAKGIPDDRHQKLITEAYLAPAIVGEWQKQVGYIPCRIFKNISYGQLGVTNSWHVYELFEHKIVYNPNTYQLFYDAQERLKTITIEEIYDLMDFVKTKHTYLNRIYTLLDFLSLLGFIHKHSIISMESNFEIHQ